jgi:hypothetical protein
MVRPVMRRRRQAREAREVGLRQDSAGRRVLNSQTGMAASRLASSVIAVDLAPGRSYLDIGCGTAIRPSVAARAGLEEAPGRPTAPGPGQWNYSPGRAAVSRRIVPHHEFLLSAPIR